MNDDNATIYSLNLRGHKIIFKEPIEVPREDIRKANEEASDGLVLPDEVINLFIDIIERLNDKIKEKKDES